MKCCANNMHGHDHVDEWLSSLDALVHAEGTNVNF
jgi:hypothetical protein